MEKIYFKTIISQQTCFTCQIFPFCTSPWQIPCTDLLAQSSWIPQCFRWSLFLFSFNAILSYQSNIFGTLSVSKPHFCHSLCSKVTYYCRTSRYQELPGRAQTFLIFCSHFPGTQGHVACCLLRKTPRLVTSVAKPHLISLPSDFLWCFILHCLKSEIAFVAGLLQSMWR